MTGRGTIHAAAALALSCTPLWAESGSHSAPSSGAGCIGLLIIYFCYKQRAQEIGGALLYYHIQLYLGTLLNVVLFLSALENYAPASWSAAPQLYPWFLASALPSVLIIPAQLVVAETLRLRRDVRFLAWLRGVLWMQLGLAILGGAIDAVHFRDYLLLDAIGVVWPGIWLPYFYRSVRVRRVYITKDWTVRESPGFGLGEALRQAAASPNESSGQGGDPGLLQPPRNEQAQATTRPPVEQLLAIEAQLDRSFFACAAALVATLGWVVYLHGVELEEATWPRAVLVSLAVALLAAYVWFAWSVGRAARALGSGRALYLAWVLVAPFLALVPIPFVSVALAASPLSLKFLLSGQLRAQVHDRTFEDD